MIVGAGIDIVEIERFERALERRGERLLARLFTARERRDGDGGPERGRALRFALRFAVKEAGMKAIGTGLAQGVGWADFEVSEVDDGFAVALSGRAAEIARALGWTRTWVAASRTRDHALAQVVLEGDPGP